MRMARTSESRLGRSFWLLLALLQLALPGATAWADARLQADSRSSDASSLVESATDKSGPRSHDVDCVFCRYLAQSFSPASPATVLTARAAATAAPPAVAVSELEAAENELPRARAPPPLS